MNQSRGPVQVGSLVPDVLEQHGVKDQIKRMTVLELWPEIVGENVASVTQARGVSERTLFVEVITSAWLMELNMMKSEFLSEVNRHLEEVSLERIIFVLGESE